MKLIIALVLSVFSLSAFALNLTSNEVFIGYSNYKTVKSRPVIISNSFATKAVMLGLQNKTTSLTQHITLGSGLSYTHAETATENTTVYSMYAYGRFWLYQNANIRPYFEYSIGPSYWNRGKFAGADLGGHWGFQQGYGFGLSVGQAHVFNFSVHAYHYSNLGLSKPHQGFDIPVMATVSYLFL